MTAEPAGTRALTAPATRARAALSQETDEELIAAYKNGKVEAFKTLLQRHERPVYRFCLRSLGSPEAAADATQEVFLRVVRNAPRWEQKAKFTTWLYTIARNYCIDEARKGRFRKTESLNEPARRDDDGGEEKLDRVAATTPSSDAVMDQRRVRAVIDETLATLPEEQREVFCLREYSGLAFKDIAEAVGANENTVKSRMRYALTALRKALETAGCAPGGGRSPDSS